jgi:hypothetical protein
VQFPELANLSAQVAALYPGSLRFINLLPNYAGAPVGGSNYTNYVDAFVREVDPDVLCVDHYPFFELPDGAKTKGSFWCHFVLKTGYLAKTGSGQNK